MPHAIADLDLLGACWPRMADDSFNERLSALNLWAVGQNFKRQGAGRLVAAGVVESSEQLDRYREAVPGCDVVPCRLRAGPDVRRARILERAREVGADADALSRRAVELSATLEHTMIDDFVVDTDGRTLGEVAELVLAGCGWMNGRVRD